MSKSRIETKVKSINELLENEIEIPSFQREYSWGKENIRRLLDDLTNFKFSNADYYIGTLTSFPMQDKKILIDGQQRIITFVLIFKIFIWINNNKYNFSINDLLPDVKIETKNEDDKKILKEFINLSQNTNLTIYIKEIENKYRNNKISNAIKTIYKYFKEDENKYISYEKMKNISNKTILVEISIGETNSELVFESINSTGLSLTSWDLIKVFLILKSNQEVNENKVVKLFKKINGFLQNKDRSIFIRYFLSLDKKEMVSSKDIYSLFKDYFNEKTKYLKDEECNKSFNKIYEEIENFFDIFLIIKNPKEKLIYYFKETSNSKEINMLIESIENIKKLEFNELNIFVIKFLKLIIFEQKEISLREVANMINLLVSWYLRRKFCEIANNKLSRSIIEILFKILKDNEDNKNLSYFERLKNNLKNRKGGQRFPNDEEFKKGFEKYSLYKDKKICKNILILLNQVDSKNEFKYDKATIEHIMPETLSEEWKNDLGENYDFIHEECKDLIGNLTLVFYNSELSNKTFLEKIEFKDNDNNAYIKDMFLNKDIINQKNDQIKKLKIV